MPQLSVAKSQESKSCHAVSLSPLNQSDINQAWESVNSCLPKRAFGVSSGGSTCGGSRQPSPLCNRRQLVRHVSKFRENGTVLVENDYVSGFFPHCAVRSDFTSTWTFSTTTLPSTNPVRMGYRLWVFDEFLMKVCLLPYIWSPFGLIFVSPLWWCVHRSSSCVQAQSHAQSNEHEQSGLFTSSSYFPPMYVWRKKNKS